MRSLAAAVDEWTRRIVALLLVIVANISPCALGAAFGVLSPAADAATSFAKRRMRTAPGAELPLLDPLPEASPPSSCCSTVRPPACAVAERKYGPTFMQWLTAPRRDARICPGELASQFVDAYVSGRELYNLRSRVVAGAGPGQHQRPCREGGTAEKGDRRS